MVSHFDLLSLSRTNVMQYSYTFFTVLFFPWPNLECRFMTRPSAMSAHNTRPDKFNIRLFFIIVRYIQYRLCSISLLVCLLKHLKSLKLLFVCKLFQWILGQRSSVWSGKGQKTLTTHLAPLPRHYINVFLPAIFGHTKSVTVVLSSHHGIRRRRKERNRRYYIPKRRLQKRRKPHYKSNFQKTYFNKSFDVLKRDTYMYVYTVQYESYLVHPIFASFTPHWTHGDVIALARPLFPILILFCHILPAVRRTFPP